jgi:Tfp pilus assembly protein FimT
VNEAARRANNTTQAKDGNVRTKVVRSARGASGFSAAELIVVCAIIGVLAAASIPFFLNYYQAAALKTAAEELATFLNYGRQQAIRQNQSMCVVSTSGSIQLKIGTCAGTTFLGGNTDSSGNLKVPSGFTVASSANPIFSYLGAAAPAATYTVTNTRNNRTLTVTVAASGRITIGP